MKPLSQLKLIRYGFNAVGLLASLYVVLYSINSHQLAFLGTGIVSLIATIYNIVETVNSFKGLK